MPLPLLNHVGYRKDLIKLFEEINYTWSVKHPGFRIKGAGLLMLLFQRIIILTNKIVLNDSDSRIERIKRYITEHYFESIPISKMSEIARLNPFYFKTLFKQETGITPHIYLIQTRVKAAEELLRSGNYKVADVSRLCGYADVYHFSKQFKKILGCSPSACIPNRSSLL
jgi:AraC-like DNA-binding protein